MCTNTHTLRAVVFILYKNQHTIFEIRTAFEINKYKYYRKLNVGLAVYTVSSPTNCGAQFA